MNSTNKLITVLILTSLSSACSLGGNTRPPQFFVLDTAIEKAIRNNSSTLEIGIGPISIPGYINRPQIVTKTNSAEVRFDEFARWAEPIDAMFTRTLAQNIKTLTSSQSIYAHPWPKLVSLDYRISAKVIKFENDIQGDALLIVHWGVVDESDTTDYKVIYSQFTAKSISTSYSARVAALNDTLAQFAEEIVNNIN